MKQIEKDTKPVQKQIEKIGWNPLKAQLLSFGIALVIHKYTVNTASIKVTYTMRDKSTATRGNYGY